MKKFILLCGVSGSGKSFIAEKLTKQKEFADIVFRKLNQVTTRAMRENEVDGKDYVFLNKEKYDKMKSRLIAKTNFYNNFYGTIDESYSYLYNGLKNINIIIVNREGRDASIKDIREKYGDDAKVITIQIVNNRNEVKREGRNENDLLKEKDDLSQISDIELENNTGDWLSECYFIKKLKEYKFID